MNLMLPCCCGCDPSPTPVKRFVQATHVDNYPTLSGKIPVYPRVYYTSCFCSPSDTDCNGAGEPVCYTHGYDGSIPSNAWNVPGVQPPDISGGELVSQILDNYFKHDGTTMQEFPSHCTYGWKAVAAQALWRGRWGFVNGNCGCDEGDAINPDFKYSSMTYACSSSQTVTNTGSYGSRVVTHNIEWNQTCTVDGDGNIIRSGSRRSNKTDTATTPTPEEWTDNCYGLTPIDNSWSENTGNSMWAPPACDAACGIITSSIGNGTAAEIMDTFSNLDDTTLECDDGGGSVTLPNRTVTSGSIKPSITITDNRIEITRNCTVVMHQYDSNCAESGTRTHTTTFSLVITLSGQVTYQSVLDEAEALLGEWSLSDDAVYPWRHDAKAWLLPLVTRDAGGGAPNIDWTTDEDCSLVGANNYSGEIRGKPLPAGYGYYFNFFHKQYCAHQPVASPCGACETDLGELGAAPLPMTATQWTEKPTGAEFRGHGAHIWNLQSGQYGNTAEAPFEGVRMVKWAETLVKWPAINFARPCGRDRYLYDETAHVCGTLAGSDLTLDETATLSGKVAIDDGVYQITGGSGINYTVGARLYDLLIPNDGVAPLRFPTARAICSTLNCTATQTSPGLITVETTGNHWLKRGGTEKDTLTFTGIGGLTTAEATVVDDTSFTVAGTLTTSPSSGTVSHGATAEQIAFDTTCSRNTFIAREWQGAFRAAALDPETPAYSVTETEVTLSPIAKHPTVLYSTPNGESFPHGYEIPWGSIGSDMCYGDQWSARFEQAIADPLWQADHVPCGHVGTWAQRDNPCEAADSNHYKFPPLVEPLIDLPAGAPTPSFTFFTSQGIPGAVGHPNCEIDPYTPGFPMSWRESWLTCEEWKELIAFKC